MSSKIEACPFCGQRDALVEQLDSDASVVICQGLVSENSACLARGPVGVQDSDNEDQPGRDAAIREWNLRSILAAPVVERQPDAWRYKKSWRKTGWMLQSTQPDPLEVDPETNTVEPLYTAPPELAELQATITELETKLNNAINLDFERRETIAKLTAEVKDLLHTSVKDEVFGIVCKERDQFKAEIERLNGGQGEAVCPACNGSGEGWVLSDASPDAHNIQVDCQECNGRGSLLGAYESMKTQLNSLGDRYVKAGGELFFMRSNNERITEALKFYADRNHYSTDDGLNWDSCSGEPSNILWHEEQPWFIEDGTVARSALNATRPSHANAPADSGTHPHNDGLDDYRGSKK